MRRAILFRADLTEANLTEEQLAQAKGLERVTLPDGTEYTSETEREPTPAEAETDNAEGQPDQPNGAWTGPGFAPRSTGRV